MASFAQVLPEAAVSQVKIAMQELGKPKLAYALEQFGHVLDAYNAIPRRDTIRVRMFSMPWNL